MSVMSKLAVVPTSDETSNETPLSQARENLAKRHKRRKEADAALQDIVAQHRRVEKLIPNKQVITDRLQELEAEHSALIENWAMIGDGDGGSPTLPHAAEIEQLKTKLHEADDVAVGTKSALGRLNEHMVACQYDCSQAINSIRAAADNVLVEYARELAEELEPLERRAALIRGHLVALQQHFILEGQRGRASGSHAGTVARMTPRGPFELSNQSINEITNKWNTFAGRLFTNENAKMEINK